MGPIFDRQSIRIAFNGDLSPNVELRASRLAISRRGRVAGVSGIIYFVITTYL